MGTSNGPWLRLMRALGLLKVKPQATRVSVETTGAPRRARASARDDSAQIAEELDPLRLEFLGAGSAGNGYFVVGLDFGTSCSKVVIRGLFVGAERAYAVPLSSTPEEPYLLPTELFRNEKGEFALTGSVGDGRLPDLKVRLLLDPNDGETQRNASLYLALVLRGAREWFLRTQRTRYGNFALRWSANIGIPSAGYDDDDIQRAFARAAAAGWFLSTIEEPLTSRHLEDAWAKLERGVEAPVTVIPEVVAAAAGYARSRRAKNGLHLMVDVGASTLDLCGFGLINDGEGQRHVLFSTVVEHLGAAVLHMDRVRALDGCDGSGPACTIDPRDPRQVVPDDLAAYVPEGRAIPEGLRKADERLATESAMAARTVLVQTWRRDPKTRDWKEGLPVFLCGGGGSMSFYKDVIDESVALHGSFSWSKLRVSQLEMPVDLEPLEQHGSRLPRMIVAYGLSFGSVDYAVDGLVRPQDVPEVPLPPARRMDDRYVSKDMV